jgi:hypothetical protein
MMSGQQQIASLHFLFQDTVTSASGRLLGAFAGPHSGVHRQNSQRYCETLANLAAMSDPVKCLWLQIVLHMDGLQGHGQLLSSRGQPMQQNMGIRATAVGDNDPIER